MAGTRMTRACAAAVIAVGVLLSSCVPGTPDPTGTPTEPPLPEPTFIDPPTGPQSVFIPRAAWDEDADVLRAWAFVTALSEDGGTCTLMAVHDDEIVELTTAGGADASTTVCGEFDISEPASGVWTLTVSYASVTVAAVSEPLEVMVP